MLTKFNLNLATLDQFSVLLQGIPNAGKTHLGMDMLRTEREHGKVAFLDVKGEKGWGSGSHMDLGEIGYRAETKGDVEAFAEICIRDKVHAAVLDGGRHLYGHIMTGIVGANRLPDAKVDGERARTYWSNARFEFEQTILLVKTSVNILLVTSVSAQDVHEITGEKQTAPDIYGKAGSGLVGLFDFSGYIKTVRILGPGRQERSVSFEVRNDVQTRQRLAHPLTEPIILPEGFGGWAKIKAALTAGLGKEAKK